MSFEDTVKLVRDNFRPVDLNKTKEVRPTPTETDVQQVLEKINDQSKNPDDKIRIATRLKADEVEEFSKIGTPAAHKEQDRNLSGLPLADRKREQQYLVDVYAAALDKLSPK